jgi:ABC-type lipoprotein export system ATPase subunit
MKNPDFSKIAFKIPEPTSNLDNESSDKVIEMFKKINEEFGTTVIIVTHDPRMLTITSNRYVLRDGKLMKYENNR